MKISAAFPSKYLKAADLQDKNVTLIMNRVELEDIQGEDHKKPVLYFEKAKKGLVLNVTNSKAIARIYGDNTDDWEGKAVTLFPAMVDFKGDTVEAIRLKAPQKAAAAKLAAKPEPVYTEADPPPHDGSGMADMDDEIPF